ncbi:MAG: glucose-6-phosphate dehydrogenase [Microbacteriaceae bacterium]|nr:glucose-6-phosphate dehydrogenase [Microbacteriaceae bacterium]HOA86229.1 glucose-6-phosphate dehydrogenase [Microbacteriaceae bacterium]HQC92777.1 glucose-6-phosphate dehydrogenase [Microbacteriaceae bacterium]
MRGTTTLCILGASGDLSSRLLLPALGQLLTLEPERDVRLLGAGQDDWDDEHWQGVVRAAFATMDASGPAVEALLRSTRYRRADVTDPDALEGLLAASEGRVALYFALPPAVAAQAGAALAGTTRPPGLIVALEKPFGADEAHAHALNERLATILPESQVHRVDHFLGRSTVLNVLGMRFANRVFEPTWSAEHIESVVIRYDEQLGLEGRADYYDHAGALVDMLQSHLLQVLAIVAMERPASLDEGELRDAISAALHATRVWRDDPVASSRRARYTAGRVGDREFAAYADAPGVDPARDTETLAEVTLQVATERWAGVPFTLRSGKALGALRREIVMRFKPLRMPTGFTGTPQPDALRIVLGPDRIDLAININININGESESGSGSGSDPFSLDRAVMSASFTDGGLSPYGEVLAGILDGDPTLSVRGDTAEQCWRIVQPVLDAWRAGAVPLDEYAAGTQGPSGWAPL